MDRISRKTQGAMTLIATVAILFSMAQAQQDPSSSGQQSGGAVPAATGPDAATQTIENPPLSGLDSPSFAPGFGARSYLLVKAQLTQAERTPITARMAEFFKTTHCPRTSAFYGAQDNWPCGTHSATCRRDHLASAPLVEQVVLAVGSVAWAAALHRAAELPVAVEGAYSRTGSSVRSAISLASPIWASLTSRSLLVHAVPWWLPEATESRIS